MARRASLDASSSSSFSLRSLTLSVVVVTWCFFLRRAQKLATSYMKQNTLVLLVVEAGIPSVGNSSAFNVIPVPAAGNRKALGVFTKSDHCIARSKAPLEARRPSRPPKKPSGSHRCRLPAGKESEGRKERKK